MLDMASKQIIPAVVGYTKSLADTVCTVKAAGVDNSVQIEILSSVSELLRETKEAFENLKKVTNAATAVTDAKEKAFYYRDTVKTAMDALRTPVDKLEMLVDKKVWPMPTYADLMFEV